MKELIKRVFGDKAITLFGIIPFSACRVINRRKLDSLGFLPKVCITFAIPYYAGEFEGRNLSRYAVARDYHLYAASLRDQLTEELTQLFPENRFEVFADNSPVDERDAAVKCGVGIRGKNGLVITEDYGSYIFLGEVLSDLSPEIFGSLSVCEERVCEDCGKCLAACPKKNICLSALTQKKGDLTPEEEGEILALGSCWGCDICQEVCPHNRGIAFTPIGFFREVLIPRLDEKTLAAMSDEAFSERAYSWRGRKTVLRNLLLLEKEKTE